MTHCVTHCLSFCVAFTLTQVYSLFHPGQEVFGIAAPHLCVLQRCLHSIFTATEGQVCFLGWEGVHQHHCKLHKLEVLPRDHSVHWVTPLSSISSLQPQETTFYSRVNSFIRQDKDAKQATVTLYKGIHKPKTGNNDRISQVIAVLQSKGPLVSSTSQHSVSFFNMNPVEVSCYCDVT